MLRQTCVVFSGVLPSQIVSVLTSQSPGSEECFPERLYESCVDGLGQLAPSTQKADYIHV